MALAKPRYLALCTALTATLLLTAAAAKPQISLTTRSARISVQVVDALARHPGLVDDCLAEGRRWVTQMRADAEEEYKTNREYFAGGRRWTFERDYAFRSLVGGRYVSIVRTDGTYTGGAHPNTYIDTILWDREAKRRISVRPFFTETEDNGPTMTALARLVRIAVAKEKIARDAINVEVIPGGPAFTPERLAEADGQIAEGIQPTLLKLGPVTLAPSTERGKSSGLTFHFSPYAVGAYAEGPYTAFVPWTELKPYLSPAGAAIFGGERPANDAKE